MHHIDSSAELSEAFSEGKMLGVLVVLDKTSQPGFLAGFSGNVGGRSMIEGFVPPIFDLTDPDGYFKRKEVEISTLNMEIIRLEESQELSGLQLEEELLAQKMEEELRQMKAAMAERKRERDALRSVSDTPEMTKKLILESQRDKADFRRLRMSWERKTGEIRNSIAEIREHIDDLKHIRAGMSEELQKWIFDRYEVHNACGEKASIMDIFASQGLVPPGGTGECAAPKLLEHAYRHGLIPIAMGEFWYGRSPETAVRTHGHFYPSCTSKCGPLLGFMLKGLSVMSDRQPLPDPLTVYQDNDVILICKPSGMPSVPGLDGRSSALEWLSTNYSPDIIPVHRLDMDTSGIMIFARTEKAAEDLRRQFEEHSVRKTYIARLSAPLAGEKGRPALMTGDRGSVSLALSPDFDERPRQKADLINGKDSLTEYEVTAVNTDGTVDIRFHPVTGRTHQLRVHSAHRLGLGYPISGDMLYGGASAARLHLHALSITFRHPSTKRLLTFSCKDLCW